jgi:hypothetical protein
MNEGVLKYHGLDGDDDYHYSHYTSEQFSS